MSYGRILFGIAAAANLIAAGTLVFYPESQLERLGITEPQAKWLARMLASSASTWGLAYLLIAIDARRFRDLIWLGAISKTLFGAISIAGYFSGALSLRAFLPGLLDLILAALFAEFYIGTRRERRTAAGTD